MLAGTISINNRILSLTQTDYTTHTTLVDMAGTSYDLGASKALHAYAFDNAGTLEIRTQEWATSGDTPVFDTDYNYWKHPSVGVTARFLGAIWTDGSNHIRKFRFVGMDRVRTMHLEDINGIFVVSNQNQASYTGITITPYFTGEGIRNQVWLTSVEASGNAASTLSIDGGTTDFDFIGASVLSTSSQFSSGRSMLPYSGTLHYKSTVASKTYVAVLGVEWFI